MKPIISLSTSYLQRDWSNDGYGMLQEAATLGYEYVELGHSTPIAAIEGILKAVSEGVVKVSSTHNFCPMPPFIFNAAPDLYSPSTKSKIESAQWQRHTKTSIDFAKSTGAKAIVCHIGSLSYFFSRPDSKLIPFLEKKDYASLVGNANYTMLVEKFLRLAKKRSIKNYKNTFKNFNSIIELAKAANLELCIENREHPSALPTDQTFPELMQMFADIPQVNAWHDVGHSKIRELSQLGNQLEFAETILPYQRGWHLHDCSENGKDHIAIGKGIIDFKGLSKFFDKEKHIFTLELNNHAVSRKEAADSLKRIQDLL